MRHDAIQMAMMKQNDLLAVALTPYVRGRVIDKYLSMLMVQRFRMDAVQHVTSNDTHMLQTVCPSPQRGLTSWYRASGITKRATQRSVRSGCLELMLLNNKRVTSHCVASEYVWFQEIEEKSRVRTLIFMSEHQKE